jgi:hypothetical protein
VKIYRALSRNHSAFNSLGETSSTNSAKLIDSTSRILLNLAKRMSRRA